MTNPVAPLADLLAQVTAVLSGIGREQDLHHADDQALASAIALGGDVLRLAEGLLLEGIAEVAERSRMRAVDERLTTRLGCHNLNELVQRLTRCSAATASRFERA